MHLRPLHDRLIVQRLDDETSDIAGDGTTTAAVLAQVIYREGAKNVTAGADPMAIKRGIEQAVEMMTRELNRMSKPEEHGTQRPLRRSC